MEKQLFVQILFQLFVLKKASVVTHFSDLFVQILFMFEKFKGTNVLENVGCFFHSCALSVIFQESLVPHKTSWRLPRSFHFTIRWMLKSWLFLHLMVWWNVLEATTGHDGSEVFCGGDKRGIERHPFCRSAVTPWGWVDAEMTRHRS